MSHSGTVLGLMYYFPIFAFGTSFTQVILCAYMMYKAIDEYGKADYIFICNEYNPASSGVATAVWIFYLSKIFDFFDTIFIIFRRKWRQLSFLHVYHHTTIFLVQNYLSIYDRV